MDKKINVLSLFDGMSCGQIALQRIGIHYDNYFASEIDKYAIKITQKNYPNTIQLGDINNWVDWQLPEIDLLIGGSPCQGFSIAGEGQNFNDPRSELFFRYVECLKWYEPKWFLLENVKMKREWKDIISNYLKVKPILINSALVSAQNRERLYWTNIPDITQPEDKGILLRDIIEDNPPNYVYLHKGHAGYVKSYNEKVGCLTGGGHSGGNHSDMTLIRNGECYRRLSIIECERLQTIPDNYTEGVSNTQRYKMLGNGWTVDVIAHILSFMGLI